MCDFNVYYVCAYVSATVFVPPGSDSVTINL